MTTRAASHSGSWYSSDPRRLSVELNSWLSSVPETLASLHLPVPGARVIIAPHAGFSYSGPASAYAYATLSILPTTKRIFLLGPSHVLYLPGCALSTHSYYATPFGNLAIDTKATGELRDTNQFDIMSRGTDEREHSLEMHLPFIYKRIAAVFGESVEEKKRWPGLVPVLVGSTDEETEKTYGDLFAKWLKEEENVFVVSSDFCHWGLRFQYTYYLPNNSATAEGEGYSNVKAEGYSLKKRDKTPRDPPIYESIARLDKQAMDAIESGKHSVFLRELRCTGNTVCGRHPIGVVMAALESLWLSSESEPEPEPEYAKGKFRFVRYERSSECVDVVDSSVSYASAYAVL